MPRFFLRDELRHSGEIDGGMEVYRQGQGWRVIRTASGTATITSGNTSVAVTHGLGVTPGVENISITFNEQGTNDYGRWWVDTITSTQFTLNVSADPGASNLTFGWQVIVL